MIAAVDIGGTKTLIAVFDDDKIIEQIKFPTPKAYEDFQRELADNVAKLSTKSFSRAAVAIPGVLDRTNGRLINLGNLDWENLPVVDDFSKILGCPVAIENDAKLAGLAEAKLLQDRFDKVLYVTVSTGIGIALINHGVIDDAVGDTGGHDMYVAFEGERTTWEKLASGSSIYARYGKKASDIDDPEIWKVISEKIAVGLIDLIALFQPEVIVIGGGVGTHYQKFEEPLKQALNAYDVPMTTLPEIMQAQNPEEAVVYGCYEYAKTT
jgi:predicted NBD/HSP70 family sugar kinase